MRFEGGTPDDESENRPREAANGWYFYIPPVVLGIWLVVGVARVVAFVLVNDDIRGVAGQEQSADGVRHAIDVVDWLGGLACVLLFLFSFMLLSRKRAPAWWSVGAFCPGPNLLLYIALLFMSKRPAAVGLSPKPDFQSARPLRPASLLRDSFVCESCDSLLNYGASECHECGELYRYVDGKPQIDDRAMGR